MSVFDVIVVGSLNTDLSVFTDTLPGPGETVLGDKLVIGFGGKGANQSVAARLLGGRVALVGKTGCDDFGYRFRTNLDKFGVNTDAIFETKDTTTGAAFITIESSGGENRIIVIPSANLLLSVEDINGLDKKGFFSSRVLLCQFEISPSTTLHSLQVAKHNGLITVLNPAPPPRKDGTKEETEYYRLLPKILEATDYCCPNETEAMQLVRCLPKSDVNAAEYGHEIELDGVAKKYLRCLSWLAEQGVRYPVVTLGSNGLIALIATSILPPRIPNDVKIIEHPDLNYPAKTIIHVHAPTVSKVTDTTDFTIILADKRNSAKERGRTQKYSLKFT
ncbi:unnamed protein product [Calicophoron daubneyi]|uniref:Carbohydrate kinase PfkB domain-containing protein n=1 Tax=Calicophoron daubneyi TaxID=300641 RepID=A0AAV2TPX4_CALDB